MTSVFYDVIYLESICGGLNGPVEGQFDSFIRKSEPQNVVHHRACGLPKDTSFHHNACFEPLYVKIHPRVTSVSKSGENKNKTEEVLYFTHF